MKTQFNYKLILIADTIYKQAGSDITLYKNFNEIRF